MKGIARKQQSRAHAHIHSFVPFFFSSRTFALAHPPTSKTSTIKVKNKERQETGLTGQTWSKTIDVKRYKSYWQIQNNGLRLRDEHWMRNMKFCMKQKTDTVWTNTNGSKCNKPQRIQTSYIWVVHFFFYFSSFFLLFCCWSQCTDKPKLQHAIIIFACAISCYVALPTFTHIPFPFQAAWYSHDDFNINRTSFSLKSVEENATQKEK